LHRSDGVVEGQLSQLRVNAVRHQLSSEIHEFGKRGSIRSDSITGRMTCQPVDEREKGRPRSQNAVEGAARHIPAVTQGGMQLMHVTDEAPQRVLSGERDTLDMSSRDGRSAEDARLEGHIERVALVLVGTELRQSVHLGVSQAAARQLVAGRCALAAPAPTSGHHCTVRSDDNRAHRWAPGDERLPGKLERVAPHWIDITPDLVVHQPSLPQQATSSCVARGAVKMRAKLGPLGRAWLRGIMAAMQVSAGVLAAVSRTVGTDVRLKGRTARGESGSTFLLTGRHGDAVLKLVPDAPDALDNQYRLVRLVEQLRSRGYPAPRYLGIEQADGWVFTVQEHLTGQALEPVPGVPPAREAFRAVLPELLDAIELQRDAGDLADPPWPAWLLDTIDRGGDGYCLHDTMRQRSDTAGLLDRLMSIATRNASGPVRRSDLVHFDLSPANVLHEGGKLKGIVDWNVPFTGAAQGDRGFDVATLLFYSFDIDATRDLLWSRAAQSRPPLASRFRPAGGLPRWLRPSTQ
jgi:aminoglycoside phosphotransferase (APT) family kinase protein